MSAPPRLCTPQSALQPSCATSSLDGHQCCKVCKTGKACGDTCIAKDKTCTKGVGCACNFDEVERKVNLVCTASVERGGKVECKASPEPAEAAFQVTGWTFEGGGHTVTASADQGATWAGTMVVGGTVTVSATVDGRAQTASAQVR